MTRGQRAVESIHFARNYTLELIETIPGADWFKMPGGITHVAWQVGHVAMAEYRLCLLRCRGQRPEDQALISEQFQARFRGDTVDPDPAKYPSPPELRAVLDRVHEQTLAEVPTYTDVDLDAPMAMNHRYCKIKADCLVWAPHHELTHAGQIGLLRRLLGQKPIW
jgi:hypothetical protein